MRAKKADRRWVFLIGFSGAGKSTVGQALARRQGCRFVDLDRTIELTRRRSVAQIFAESGEMAFRREERAALRRVISQGRPGVVALGGGAFEQPLIRELARAHGRTVFLSCSVRELYRRLRMAEDRPLLMVTPRRGETGLQARLRRIRSLLKKRLANYRRADLILSTSTRTVSQTARQLQILLGKML